MGRVHTSLCVVCEGRKKSLASTMRAKFVHACVCVCVNLFNQTCYFLFELARCTFVLMFVFVLMFAHGSEEKKGLDSFLQH